MKRRFANRSLLFILLASVFSMVVASATSSINLPFTMASSDGGEGGGSGGGDDSGGDNDPEPEPEPEPDPEPSPDPEPEPTPEPTPEPIVPKPIIPEPEPTIECPVGTVLNEAGDACISEEPTDTTAALLPTSKEVLPYCDLVGDDYQGACHDRYDYDEITGLYPCNDGTSKEDPLDCEDAYVPPEDGYCAALGCPGSPPDPVYGCFDGSKSMNGNCPKPKPEPKCPPGWEYREKHDDCFKEIEIIINKIIKETNEGKHQDGFPDVDIIGLSVKQSGDAMICAMDIDSDHIECQEFGMDPQKVNQAFWRVIETDSSKNYDNGNTGSNNVDLAIQDIKNHDFDELDDDRENHNFGIDLAWVAINPQGEGVTCLTTDQNGKGKSLCEPFKVSAQDVSGQITEGVEFS